MRAAAWPACDRIQTIAIPDAIFWDAALSAVPDAARAPSGSAEKVAVPKDRVSELTRVLGSPRRPAPPTVRGVQVQVAALLTPLPLIVGGAQPPLSILSVFARAQRASDASKRCNVEKKKNWQPGCACMYFLKENGGKLLRFSQSALPKTLLSTFLFQV